MERIDVKTLTQSMKRQVKREIADLAQRGITPQLAVVAAGDDPASRVYAAGKEKDCAECGIQSRMVHLSGDCTQAEVLATIKRLNEDAQVSGILVQLPLPEQVDDKAVVEAISPLKDVDGFSPANVGKMFVGEDCLLPCTPAGCIEILRDIGCEIAGKHAVVIGRSNIVGKPMTILLLRQNATVTVCHTWTEGLADMTRQADILVAAIGRDRFVKKEMVKPGAVVVDVGINRGPDGKIHGDVDEQSLENVPGYLTPVPGGVGVMTRAMLLKNTVEACKKQHGIR